MRKTALLSGVAGLFLLSSPAFAQEGTAPQTPPAATPPEPAAEAPVLTLQPGMTVRGGDGELGVLVGARTNGDRQQLTVRGADGVVRAVPIDGIRQDGDVVTVGFTLEQFSAADTVTQPATPATPADPGETPATPATPAVPGEQSPAPDGGEEMDEPDGDPAVTATPAPPATPAVPATPAETATPPADEETVIPPAGEEAVTPPTGEEAVTPTPPMLPPETPATPEPGEGADQDPDEPET